MITPSNSGDVMTATPRSPTQIAPTTNLVNELEYL